MASTDFDDDLALLHIDSDSLGTELVDSRVLPEEHKLHLTAVGVIVDVVSEDCIDLVTLSRDEVGNTRFEVDDVGFESINLLQALEKVESMLVCLVTSLFKIDDIV